MLVGDGDSGTFGEDRDSDNDSRLFGNGIIGAVSTPTSIGLPAFQIL